MEKQLSDIKEDMRGINLKLDKVIEIDTKRQLKVEGRLSKVEIRTRILSSVTFISIVSIIGAFFKLIKDKLGV